MEDNLFIPPKPEFKIHNADPIWNQVIEMHRKRMEAHQIAYHMNMEVSLIKDIIEYVNKNKDASK